MRVVMLVRRGDLMFVIVIVIIVRVDQSISMMEVARTGGFGQRARDIRTRRFARPARAKLLGQKHQETHGQGQELANHRGGYISFEDTSIIAIRSIASIELRSRVHVVTISVSSGRRS